MMYRVVCVCVIQVLRSVAYPTTGDADTASVTSQDPVLVAGMSKFSGNVPASRLVTTLGNSAYYPSMPSDQVFVQNVEPYTVRDEYSLPSVDKDVYEPVIYGDSELLPVLENSPNFENCNMDDFSKKALLGSIIADSIITGNEAEIEAKLDEIDSFLDAELANTESIVSAILENAAVPVIEALINTDLSEAESQIAMMEVIVDSELRKVDKMIESVLKNATTVLQVEQAATQLLTDLHITPSTQILSYADVDAKLAKIDSIIESKLKKMDFFIESELAKVDLFIESELAKVDSLVKSKLARAQFLMDAELIKIHSYVDSELAKIKDVIEHEINFKSEPKLLKLPVQRVTEFSGTVPATGKVFLSGNTGYPPLFPSNPPILGNAGPFIYNDDHSSYEYNDANSLLAREDGIRSLVHNLPAVNIKHENIRVNNEDGLTEEAVVERNLNFSGRTGATGSAKVFAHFGCAPLLPTEETPDGKKHIWVSKRPRNSVIPPPPKHNINYRPTFPVMPSYPTDFPETVMTDSSKNYERFIE